MNDETITSAEVGAGDVHQGASAAVTETARTGTDWQTKLVLVAAIGAGLWGLFAPLGSGWGLWGWKTGLTGVQWSFFLGVGAMLLGLLYIWRGKRTGKPRRPLLWLGTAIAAGYTGWMISLVAGAASVPAIHDISTDLADPPQFAVLTLRADNLDNIPGAEESEMKGMSPTQRWTLLHQREYGAIRSVRINQPVNAVMAKAARLATDRGWEIAANLPAEGRLEATSTTALFRFKDNVVLRVRPTEDASGSIVDMRSVSRVGQSDLGVNAKRVQSFLADLSGTVTSTQ
jgi:Protein of unknown function (DUF1499)